MHTALVIKPDFLASLRQLVSWLLPAVPRPAEHKIAPHFIAPRADSTLARSPNTCQPKPLRVVRVMESGQPRSDVGRMVISGRMADVCAELDRLAACEAT